MYKSIKSKISISTLFKSSISASVSFLLISCNAGVASNSSNTQLAPDSLSTTLDGVSSYSEFSKTDCIKGTFDGKGNLSLSNICSTPQSFSQAILKFAAQDNNGNGVTIESLRYSDAYLFNVNTANANVAIGTLSEVSKDLILQPLQTIQFNASVIGNKQYGFNSLLANQTFEIDGIFNNSNTAIAPLALSTTTNTSTTNGPISKAAVQATANTGTLKLNIDTKNAGCNQWADCSKVMVQINDNTGAAVESVKLTSGSFGKTYSTNVDLAVGKYTITLSNVPNTTSQIDAIANTQIIERLTVQ